MTPETRMEPSATGAADLKPGVEVSWVYAVRGLRRKSCQVLECTRGRAGSKTARCAIFFFLFILPTFFRRRPGIRPHGLVGNQIWGGWRTRGVCHGKRKEEKFMHTQCN